MGRIWRAGWAVAALGLFACGTKPEDEAARRRALAEQGEALTRALDRVEARLYEGQSTVRLWQELGDRHGQVAEVTCKNLAEHVEGIERFESQQTEKTRKLRVSHRAVNPPAVSQAEVHPRHARRGVEPESLSR